MNVSIEYVNDEKSEWLVDYGAKVKARYWHPNTDDLTDEQIEMLEDAAAFAYQRANVKSLVNMGDVSAFRLVESLARTFCGLCSPRKTCDLPKSAIRWAIRDSLNQLLDEYEAEEAAK